MSTPTTAADIIVEGRVQGVGYRDFARRRAAHLGAVGYVMNRLDMGMTGDVRSSRLLDACYAAVG